MIAADLIENNNPGKTHQSPLTFSFYSTFDTKIIITARLYVLCTTSTIFCPLEGKKVKYKTVTLQMEKGKNTFRVSRSVIG